LSLFELVRKSGERVIIDGPCQSACTLVLSVVPGNRICVARRAVLGFHAAIAVDRNGRRYSASDATQVITETYPAPVRAWIGRHGGLSRRVLLLRGRELTAMYPACGSLQPVGNGLPLITFHYQNLKLAVGAQGTCHS